MNRFVPSAFATVCGAAILVLAGGANSAAPVPKDAGKNDPIPDLKAVFDTVGKAVKAEKWPPEADEKILRATVQKVFERVLKATDQTGRKIPVDFDTLTKANVAREVKDKTLDGGFVVAGDVRIPRIRNSVIFASGKVQTTNAKNCIIIAPNVRCDVVDNCVIIAGEYVRLTYARRQDGEDGSVLIAGQWIRTARMDGTICHILRPGGMPAPDEKLDEIMLYPPIRTNGAKNVIFLNEGAQTRANTLQNCTYLPQKTPIAK